MTLIGPPTLPSASFKRLRHALLVVVDVGLIEQADLLVEGLEARTRRSSRSSLAGLPCALNLSASTSFSRVTTAGSRPDGVDRLRIGRGDMHRDQPAERGELVGLAGRFQRDQHAHLAERPRSPNCAHSCRPRPCRPKARRRGAASCSRRSWRSVSAIVFGDGRAAGLGRLDLLDVGADVERDIGDHLHQALEQVVARDEVGLGIDLDDDALGAGDGDADQAFGGDAVGFLRGLGQALLAQPVDRGLDVALGFAERGLAIHHARAGLFAQVLDHLCSDLSHCSNPLLSRTRRRGARPAPPLARPSIIRPSVPWPWRPSPGRGRAARLLRRRCERLSALSSAICE